MSKRLDGIYATARVTFRVGQKPATWKVPPGVTSSDVLVDGGGGLDLSRFRVISPGVRKVILDGDKEA